MNIYEITASISNTHSGKSYKKKYPYIADSMIDVLKRFYAHPPLSESEKLKDVECIALLAKDAISASPLM